VRHQRGRCGRLCACHRLRDADATLVKCREESQRLVSERRDLLARHDGEIAALRAAVADKDAAIEQLRQQREEGSRLIVSHRADVSPSLQKCEWRLFMKTMTMVAGMMIL
jgi:hypothetical protein